jgi:GTP-binding protein
MVASYQIPMIIVATKIDKIPKTKRQKHLQLIGETLNIHPTESLLMFSALTAEGVSTIWQAIARLTLPPI